MTAQANYALLKYSRSYSSDDPARFSHQPTSSDHEWQHFSNPKLQLSLKNATPSGPFRSARVKIVWIAGGGGLQREQQENIAVLEDIDLNSFLPTSTAPKKSHHQSVPLKVVYRDSVVGFRYLHPRVIPPGASPAFRRFQICFADPLLATQFVDSIRHICPCKANPPSALVPARTVAVTTPTVAEPIPLIPASNANTATKSSLLASQPPPTRTLNLSTGALINDLQNQPHNMQSPDLQAMQCNADRSELPLLQTRTFPVDAVDVPTVITSYANHSPQVSRSTGMSVLPSKFSVAQSPEEPTQNMTLSGSNQRSVIHARASSSTAAMSISDPSSCAGDSTQRYGLENLVDASSTALQSSFQGDTPTDNFNNLATASQTLVPSGCLNDIGTIEDLCATSVDQLERLVGEVIREPKFLTLVRSLY
ncbi:hypothetical protein JB92DRAFT_3146650 [Gautieria morchelliformis]|nr:hypothetical protein JB92DRAFT_3146650 [Gautieria morchelliformis]